MDGKAVSCAHPSKNAPFWKDQSQPVKESRRSGGRPRLWCDDCTDLPSLRPAGAAAAGISFRAWFQTEARFLRRTGRASPDCPRFVPVFICVFWGQAKPYLARLSGIFDQLSPCPQDFLLRSDTSPNEKAPSNVVGGMFGGMNHSTRPNQPYRTGFSKDFTTPLSAPISFKQKAQSSRLGFLLFRFSVSATGDSFMQAEPRSFNDRPARSRRRNYRAATVAFHHRAGRHDRRGIAFRIPPIEGYSMKRYVKAEHITVTVATAAAKAP